MFDLSHCRFMYELTSALLVKARVYSIFKIFSHYNHTIQSILYGIIDDPAI